MVRLTSIAAILAFSVTALAAPGEYFPVAARQASDACQSTGTGTGSNTNTTNTTPAAAPDNTVPASGRVVTVNAGAAAVGNGKGQQFTVGPCINDADCGSGCCAGGAVSGMTGRLDVGVCSGKGSGVEFQKGKTGCGFQDPNAALTLQEAADQVKKQGF